MSNDKYTETKWTKYDKIKDLPKKVSVFARDVETQQEVEFNSDFIEKYSKYYFYDNEDDGDGPKKLKKTWKEIEEQVFYTNNYLDEQHIKRILAWKTGNIIQEEKSNKIEYAKGWKKNNNIKLPYQSEIDAGQCLCELKDVYNNKDEKSVDDIWKDIITNETIKKTRGLGTVYLITLLSFMTNGKVPIYDRFAMASLVVWKLSKHGISIPKGSIIDVGSLPEKKDAGNLMNENSMYKKYIVLLSEFCSSIYGEKNKEKWKFRIEDGKIKNYDEARNIDRALWVYGHFFDVRQ